MKVCKNIKSKRYFLYLREAGSESYLLVTPNAEIKALKKNLFYEPEEIVAESLLQDEFINQKQIWKYNEYKKFRENDANDDLVLYFENLSSSEQMSFLKRIEKLIGEM